MVFQYVVELKIIEKNLIFGENQNGIWEFVDWSWGCIIIVLYVQRQIIKIGDMYGQFYNGLELLQL